MVNLRCFLYVKAVHLLTFKKSTTGDYIYLVFCSMLILCCKRDMGPWFGLVWFGFCLAHISYFIV